MEEMCHEVANCVTVDAGGGVLECGKVGSGKVGSVKGINNL